RGRLHPRQDFYDAGNVFWVPEPAHFSTLLAQATAPDLAQRLDAAMGEIEAENQQLKGVPYREFSRSELEPGKLGELMQLLTPIKFDRATHGDRDVFGTVYEYFPGQFALKEGARAGEFSTPKSVVNLLVEILVPFKGTIYDPACGSGGMFVQSAKFKDAHQTSLKKKGDLAIHGQELMAATRRLALMNLAVHGLSGDLGESFGDTFANDQHKTLRADYVLANPPFNISDWGGDKLADDPRWVYGIPPRGNANFAWLQHMLARLSVHGRAGIVLANGSMSSQQSGEGDIRRAMVEADVVECMVALPGQLFSNTQIPACLWFMSKDKGAGQNGSIDRRGQLLFIDARKLAALIPGSRKHVSGRHRPVDRGGGCVRCINQGCDLIGRHGSLAQRRRHSGHSAVSRCQTITTSERRGSRRSVEGMARASVGIPPRLRHDPLPPEGGNASGPQRSPPSERRGQTRRVGGWRVHRWASPRACGTTPFLRKGVTLRDLNARPFWERRG
ncbi:MAG TPA: N-6 DNA methylase, partial [Rhodanobacteraceae bacterium]